MSHDIVFDPPEDIIRMPSPYAPATVPPASSDPSTPVDPPARRKGGRPKGAAQPKPPPEVTASSQARRIAAVLLEVLAGLRATGSAAKELGITPMRYYQIEERAIGGRGFERGGERRRGRQGESVDERGRCLADVECEHRPAMGGLVNGETFVGLHCCPDEPGERRAVPQRGPGRLQFT